MQISLITTTRDRPLHLLNCAKSIAKQTYQCHEWIIIIDDDISDYQYIIPEIMALVPQTVIKSIGKQGRNHALRVAHSMVTGEMVGWVDDDDWLAPNCLFECNLHDNLVIYTDFYCVENGKYLIGLRNKVPYSYEALMKENICFHFKLYSINLYHAVGGIDPSFDTTMDYELSLRLLNGITPQKINKALYYYRVHKDSITGRYRERQIINKQRAIAKCQSQK